MYTNTVNLCTYAGMLFDNMQNNVKLHDVEVGVNYLQVIKI